jgi:hypothetical protein
VFVGRFELFSSLIPLGVYSTRKVQWVACERCLQVFGGMWGQYIAERVNETMFLIEIFRSGSNPKTAQINDGAVRHNDSIKNLENICA